MKKEGRKKLWRYSAHWQAIDGSPGWKHCSVCGQKLLYVFRHDALCCPFCDEWREGACTDEHCEFCATRPERPSQTERQPPPDFDRKEWRARLYERRDRARRIQLRRRQKGRTTNGKNHDDRGRRRGRRGGV